MGLEFPKIVAIDSSTLGNVARDAWSKDPSARAKASQFVEGLASNCVFVALTLTHMCELLRHSNPRVARRRLSFLSELPLVAWLRPYDRNWFTGCMVDVFVREICAHTDQGADWSEIVAAVRADLWETGHGKEMFEGNDRIWQYVRNESLARHGNDIAIASLARTHVDDIGPLTMEQARSLPERPKEEWESYFPVFMKKLRRQLHQHADRRLTWHNDLAAGFTHDTIMRLLTIDGRGGDSIDALIEDAGIPKELVTPQTTVEEIGEMAVYVLQLGIFSRRLRRAPKPTIRDLPLGSLPGYTLHRLVAARQNLAERVNASDLGDNLLSPLVLYADAIQVDKRTCHYLDQIKQARPDIAPLMQHYFKVSDYSKIPGKFAPRASLRR